MSDREYPEMMSWNEHVKGLIAGRYGEWPMRTPPGQATSGALPSQIISLLKAFRKFSNRALPAANALLPQSVEELSKTLQLPGVHAKH